MASTRDIKFRVVVDEDVKGARKAADALDDVGDKAEHAGHDVSGFGRDLAKLDAEIAASKAALKSLGREFIETGDKATMKAFRAEGSKLRGLESVGKALEGEAQRAGQHAGHSFADAFGEGLHGMPSEVKAALFGAVAAVSVTIAPFLGAALSAAVVGGAGLGGIVGGVALAARDPRVQAAGKDLGEQISGELQDASAPFVEATLGGIAQLGESFHNIKGDLAAVFDELAPDVDAVARGLGGMLEELGPGMRDAARAAGPLIQVLGTELPRVGEAVSKAFESMSREGKGMSEGLSVVFHILERTISGVGNALGQLAHMYEVAVDKAAKLPGPLGDNARQIKAEAEAADKAASSSGGLSRAFGLMGDRAKESEDKVRSFTNTLFDNLNKTFNLQTAQINYRNAVDALSQSLRDNGATFDINTEAGRRNREAFIAAAQAAAGIAAAQQQAGVKADVATAQYDTEVAKLRELALHAGISTAALDALAGDYYVNVITTYTYRGKPLVEDPSAKYDFLHGKAAGGPVSAGVPYLVGEKGPEIFMPSTNGTIVPNGRARSAAAPAGGPMVIQLDLTGADDDLLRRLRRSVRVRGGNVQVVLGAG